ncbi:hypothetical protein [Trinickia acidisoli]|nr:hypothetical protein [Trinickia acidisoli]
MDLEVLNTSLRWLTDGQRVSLPTMLQVEGAKAAREHAACGA